MDIKYNKIAIIGSGSWGTALATIASNASKHVYIIARNEQVISDINNYHENKIYLANIPLPYNIAATSDLSIISECDLILLATPAQHIRNSCLEMQKYKITAPVILCSKGIEQESLMLMSEVVKSILPDITIAVLSGPNFAHEVACGKPAATVIASDDENVTINMAQNLSSNIFRIYHSTDLIGTQVSGSAKNILAIACGIIIGKDLGENAKAAILARGIAEITRLVIAKGGEGKTVMGLAGAGDIILTCSSTKSRNTSLGVELSSGKSLDTILKSRITVTEGVMSAKSVYALAHKLNVSMPICFEVYNILYKNKNIDLAISDLLLRPISNE